MHRMQSPICITTTTIIPGSSLSILRLIIPLLQLSRICILVSALPNESSSPTAVTPSILSEITETPQYGYEEPLKRSLPLKVAYYDELEQYQLPLLKLQLLEKRDEEFLGDCYDEICPIWDADDDVGDDTGKDEPSSQHIQRRSFLFDEPPKKAKGQLPPNIGRHRHSKPYRPRPPPPHGGSLAPVTPPPRLSKRSPDPMPKRLPENYVRSRHRKLAETSPHLFGGPGYDDFFEQVDYDPNFMATVVGREAARRHVPIKDVLAFIREYDRAKQEDRKRKEMEKKTSEGASRGWDEQDQKYFETYAEEQALKDIKKEATSDVKAEVPRKGTGLLDNKGKNKKTSKLRGDRAWQRMQDWN